MKLNPIIVSLLETDMYKFSMGQAIYHQFSDYKTTRTFKCRNKDVQYTEEMVEEIREQIKHFCTLRFTEDELDYLENVKWMKGSYVDFLRLWQARQADYNGNSLFVGTSNVYLAKKYNLTPVGTMAHEWIMCTGQGNHKHNPAYSNWYALDAWVREYGILNGIALTDAITTDCFLKDFQLTYATLFGGVRHDSGDPYEWGDKMIKHYESLGIDAANKTLLFSDSLDFDRADKLYRYFNAKAKVAFGIGTYISNDTDVPALNIVMKTTKCNGMDVAKISDNPGKGMCKNPEYVEYLQRCIDWRMNNDR